MRHLNVRRTKSIFSPSSICRLEVLAVLFPLALGISRRGRLETVLVGSAEGDIMRRENCECFVLGILTGLFSDYIQLSMNY